MPQTTFDALNGAPPASAIVAGLLRHTGNSGPTDFLTVPAGKTWVGKVTLSVTATKDAAATTGGSVRAVVTTAGTGVTPAAGAIFEVDTAVGANAATGTSGTQSSNCGSLEIMVAAPVGNTVSLQFQTIVANISTAASVASAFGYTI